MKKLILFSATFLLTMSSSFADCRCGTPKFTSDDELSAIESFVETKLDNGVVTNVELTEKIQVARYNPSSDPERNYPGRYRHGSPSRYRRYNTNYRGSVQEEFFGFEFTQVGMTKCQVECANKENSINKFNVEYTSNNKKCSVDVKVYMTSTLFGFKSLVKQKLAPVCE
jgi:hypothetical protein